MNSGSELYDLLVHISEALEDNRERLDWLDAVVGDGEHGTNISNAFLSMVGQLEPSHEGTAMEVLRKAGMTLLSVGGSAATTFYGLAMLAASSAGMKSGSIDTGTVAQMFDAAVQKIKEKGNAKLGDKTMIDCLEPACEAFSKAAQNGEDMIRCLDAAVEAGQAGTAHTRDMVGSRGRALYAGERSIGYEDPGASSALVILKTVQSHVRKIDGWS